MEGEKEKAGMRYSCVSAAGTVRTPGICKVSRRARDLKCIVYVTTWHQSHGLRVPAPVLGVGVHFCVFSERGECGLINVSVVTCQVGESASYY